ncbi:hypothetical protein PHYBLDRAFT_163974 [Phycomyces blakesleeanus NRRL 1555(-)]|uniref:Uncharacterized protein n=1 Tax=Phycomyces blakesleeanus (strain ATCC 8743b / DSM 1359 / FGSC 10004 / NBRC 33097 / NRRL 1555) TaxID=763407 RepID=A0A163B8Z4_PHYB8|nr:hypothetical protein PHYBLDRAFT_163974 [Phycomyces blakesleeanus NRRL 1555(-)]OAD78881.1 hypothetical protein PHYBLDRAFT_163974 [Phycomyces blakesleeanus NRRL 1555(-)]|eukprot:XP_018296921.1 hypothetical protein PHYBLDRAFT_163974 [Phycomyces blakesleeanus NRRL 1555(-)]
MAYLENLNNAPNFSRVSIQILRKTVLEIINFSGLLARRDQCLAMAFISLKCTEITMGDPHSINNISPHKKQILEKNDSIYIKSTLYFALLVCRRFISMEYNPITEQVIFIIVKYDTEQRSNNNEISSIVSSSRFYLDFYPVFRLLAKSHVPRIHFILSN